MPINPESKPNWRPQHDIGRSYHIRPKPQRPHLPKASQAAAKRESQVGAMKDEARVRFPGLAGVELDAAEPPTADLKKPTGNKFFDARRRPDGSVDLDGVAQDTIYIPQITKVEPALPVPTEIRPVD